MGDRHDHYWRQLTDGRLRALARLRDTGAIDAFGIGVNEVAVCLEAIRAAPLDVILLADIRRRTRTSSIRCFRPALRRTSRSSRPRHTIAVSSAAGGRYDYGVAPSDIAVVARRMETIAKEHGIPLAAAALQFPLGHPAVATVMPGLRSPQEVDQTLDWFAKPIPIAFWQALKAEGLMKPDAPTPQHPVGRSCN
ncbi:aldo/keto reductase [Sphingomonas sp. MMS24-JH45]